MRRVSLESTQPLIIKYILLALTSLIALFFSYVFYRSGKQGYWLGIFIVSIFWTINYLTISAANVYLTDQGILIVKMFRSYLKNAEDWNGFETSFYRSKIIFNDNSSYSFNNGWTYIILMISGKENEYIESLNTEVKRFYNL
jgi:hypothetical protein